MNSLVKDNTANIVHTLAQDALESLLGDRLTRPDENDRQDISDLSEKEQNRFKEIVQTILNVANQERCTVVFRGEKKNRLCQKLNPDGTFNQSKTINRLFYFGEKAKSYHRSNQPKLKGRKYLKHIGDASEETFKFIFDKFSKIFKDHLRGNFSKNPKPQKRLNTFKSSNRKFFDFFIEPSNIDNFKSGVETFSESCNALMQVRDYYLYLLHTFGKSGISELSFFVSTSTDKAVAEEFALSKSNFELSHEGVVFYYWIPEPLIDYACSKVTVKQIQENMESTSLPFYSSDLYPKQKEVSVKGGLFPHFILGYYDLEKRCFVVNSHVFSQTDDHRVVQMGFSINQKGFEKAIEETGYSGYIVRYYNGLYLDFSLY